MPNYSVNVKSKKCVTPECRGSYVNILEPRPLPQSEEMAWGMQCIFPKTPEVEAWMGELKKIYAQVLIDKFGKEKAEAIAKVISAKGSFPVRDGDKPEDAGALANAEQLKGCYFLNTNNKFRQPHIIGAMGNAIDPETLTPDDIYSGAWYRVMLEFWYYDTAGNKGISTSVAAVMKTKDDENLGVGTSKSEASDAFSDFAGEAVGMDIDGEPEDGSDTQGLPGADVDDPEPESEFNFL